MKLKRPRFRAQVACALAALGSSALLAGGVLASPAVAGEDSTFTGSVAPLMNPFLRLAVAEGSTAPGARVIDWSIDDGAEQEWTFKPVEGALNTFQIINKNSNQCLTTDGVAGDQVYQDPCNGSRSQQWITGINAMTQSIAFYTIQSASSGLYLDVYGDSPWEGTVIDTWYGNGGNNQEWAVNPSICNGSCV